VLRWYAGLETRDDELWLHPVLPAELARTAFEILYRGQPISIEITHTHLRLHLYPCAADPIQVCIHDEVTTLSPGQTHQVSLPMEPAVRHTLVLPE